jgi:hypothetical protein
MDLANLEKWANAINGQTSPNIKRWALEQVRVTKELDGRLLGIEVALARAVLAEDATLNETAAAVRALKG